MSLKRGSALETPRQSSQANLRKGSMRKGASKKSVGLSRKPSIFRPFRSEAPLALAAPTPAELQEAFTLWDISEGSRGLVAVASTLTLLRSLGYNPSSVEFARATESFPADGVTNAEFAEIAGRLDRAKAWTAEKMEAYSAAFDFFDRRPGEATAPPARALNRHNRSSSSSSGGGGGGGGGGGSGSSGISSTRV